jgi:hypothetical protein
MLTFDEILAQVTDLVQQQGRVSYRVLKRRFDIDDEYLEDLKAELIDAKRLAADEDGKVLVWVGEQAVVSIQESVAPPSLIPVLLLPTRRRTWLILRYAPMRELLRRSG